jgi:hypothetical protein
MVIVKNLLSFYVEFEIMLYFLLFCRLWSVNKDVNVRNEAWSEMDRTYTKNQVKSTSGQELRTVIIKIVDRNNGIRSLVRAVKKVQKLRTVFIGAGSANLRFESGFSWELRDYCIPSSLTSLN